MKTKLPFDLKKKDFIKNLVFIPYSYSTTIWGLTFQIAYLGKHEKREPLLLSFERFWDSTYWHRLKTLCAYIKLPET